MAKDPPKPQHDWAAYRVVLMSDGSVVFPASRDGPASTYRFDDGEWKRIDERDPTDRR